jgi:hypothetical protein
MSGNLDCELKSLGLDPRSRNELNDNAELEALVDNLKLTYYQDYKAAYDCDLDASHFDHFI